MMPSFNNELWLLGKGRRNSKKQTARGTKPIRHCLPIPASQFPLDLQIAHRLSAIQHVDRIIVLDENKNASEKFFSEAFCIWNNSAG
jgi:hypothetical protein